MSWESTAIEFLSASLIRPMIPAALVWLGLRVFRVRSPAVEHVAWTAALACLLLIPAVTLAPHWKLHVLRARRAAVAGHGVSETAVVEEGVSAVKTRSTPAHRESNLPSGEDLVLALYGVGLASMVAYRATGWLMLRGLVRRSRRVSGRVRESDELATPVAIGLVGRCVILPAGWREWPASERRAVLAHEFAHLRRGDAYVAALARAAQTMLWFHPLAWWMGRKISECAELACDVAALRRSGGAAEYSRLLLGFAEAVGRTGERISLPGLAMATGSQIGRRIERIFELSERTAGWTARVSRRVLATACVGVPVMCLAATATLAEQEAQPAAAPIPKFTVVSVKPCTDGDAAAIEAQGGRGGPGGRTSASPGRISLECTTADNLIRNAYLRFADGKIPGRDPKTGRPPFLDIRKLQQEIKGSPGWLKSDRFTVDATAEGAPGREMMIGPMMRAVLAERFALKIRTEMRDTPVYLLTVAKGGAKLQPTAGDCIKFDPANLPPVPPAPGKGPGICGGWFINRSGEARGKGVDMADLAGQLSTKLDYNVIDKTGIMGSFDILLELSVPDAFRNVMGNPELQARIEEARSAATDPPGTSVIAAVGRLGLRLDLAKVPEGFLVIDHVEKPTAN